MLESLNYSFRNTENMIWVIYFIKQLRNYKKNHGVLRGPQLGKQCWRTRLGILRVKEKAELYLCSTSGPAWPVIRCILLLPLPLPLLSISSGSSLNSVYTTQLFENQVISARILMRDTIFLWLPCSAGFKFCWKWVHLYSWLEGTVTWQQSCSLAWYIKVDNKLHLLKQRSIMK